MVRRFSAALFLALLASNSYATPIGDFVDVSIGGNTSSVQVADGNLLSMQPTGSGRTASLDYIDSTDTFRLFVSSSSIPTSGFTFTISDIDWAGQPGVITGVTLDSTAAIQAAISNFNLSVCGGDPICLVDIQLAQDAAVLLANTLSIANVIFSDDAFTLEFPSLPTNGASFVDINLTVAPVPIPAAAWLFLSALGGLFGIRKLKAS